MQLLVIRHAKAEDGADDVRRSLSAEGREEMSRAAEGLAKLVEDIDVVVSSPLKRAVQTAQIVANACGRAKIKSCEALLPGREPQEVVRWLHKQQYSGLVALVGHEPDMSRLVSWLLTGKKRAVIEMKKGAAVLLDISGEPEGGQGTMKWHLTCKQLGCLGKS